MSRYAQRDAEKLKTAFEVKWKEKSVVTTMDIAEAQRRVRKIKILACIIFDDEIKKDCYSWCSISQEAGSFETSIFTIKH